MELYSLLFAIVIVASNCTTADISSCVDFVVVETNQELCVVSENFLSVAIDTKFIFKHNLSILE